MNTQKQQLKIDMMNNALIKTCATGLTVRVYNTLQQTLHGCVKVGLAVMAINGSALAVNPSPITATYTVTTQSPTCAIARADGGGGTVTLGNIKQGVLQSPVLNPAAAQGKALSMKLTCKGNMGAFTPTIKIYGDRVDAADSRLYANNTTNGSANVGFLLTQNATGAVNNSQQILRAGTSTNPTKVVVTTNGNANPNGITIPFFLQVTRGNHAYSTVTSGPMTTTLHFEFLYE